MPTKTWEPPPVQQDRDPQPENRFTDQPRSFDAPGRAPDANADARDDEEPINTHGSER
jgi:hypothetical protein